jgi:hypothetical protein
MLHGRAAAIGGTICLRHSTSPTQNFTPPCWLPRDGVLGGRAGEADRESDDARADAGRGAALRRAGGQNRSGAPAVDAQHVGVHPGAGERSALYRAGPAVPQAARMN